MSQGQGMKGMKGKALVSVSDKSGVVELARGLVDLGYEVVSTGGSFKAISEAGVAVSQVESMTNFPEMLDGRVKTLHPAVHGGILARRDLEDHMEAMENQNFGLIDVVVCNLYPFRATVTGSSEIAFQDAIEKIDIGGPTLIRAAAKNHKHVTVIVDPTDYTDVLTALGSGEEGSAEKLRTHLAWKAFQHVSSYDSNVSEWLWENGGGKGEDAASAPPEKTIPVKLVNTLRYGENPHQKAAFYVDQSLGEHDAGGLALSTQHHGKEMSFNNFLDGDAAYSCVCDFVEPTCVIVKHTNPCGVASAHSGQDDPNDLRQAYRWAVEADPVSAFGGIVAFNRPVTEELAKEIREFRSPQDGDTRMFYEIVIAPGYTEKGLEVLKGKSKTLRILEAKPHNQTKSKGLKQIGGGFVLQEHDFLTPEDIKFEVVSEKQPTAEELEDLKFAWRCVKHVKSNAITIAKGKKLLGMGSGQPNRVKSVEIAIEKAADEIEGSVMASDAFFPFAWNDSVEKACQAGVKAIVHPGGSIRDSDAIECCNKYNVALLTTSVRHFKH
ncbi:bifunctional purine biosynthesis protein PurH [Chloropicon primus]|uniref:Bifunctional purine biosynthesis protein PurH n=1 Tax=Chloropicon primus TaxID=1764295 RepID=A0A5B8MUN2_9CHLO|nr:bifunctional purine biosynthesis protein PurH [Chloropicon primus]UPR02557.1 bifunctional purine biosynthesis protein PurH [Chloropicon primus]|eukprot:QDZ23345.1 bifunctional purine biosynthesis protein PurH [Chloropicon primus]